MTRNRTIPDKVATKSANASIASHTVAFALHHGLTLAHISEVTGINGRELADPNYRPPEVILPAIWNLLSTVVPSDEPLTMHMAEAAPLSFFADLAHGVSFTSTIQEAIEMMIEYRRIISDQVEIEFTVTKTEAAMVVAHPFDDLDAGRTSEVGLAIAWRLLAQLSARPIFPKRVEFVHAPTGSLAGYRRLFGLNPVFGSGRTALILAPCDMTSPVSGGNSALLGYVNDHLSRVLSNINVSPKPNPIDKVRLAVVQCAEVGEFGVRSVSERVGLGYRQAQRLAAAHGTTLRELINENRLAIACDFLREGKSTMDEIALALGYTDDRAFRRAFKRHYGLAPSKFRLNYAVDRG